MTISEHLRHAEDRVSELEDEADATKAEIETLLQWGVDEFRRANRAEAWVERLQEENRSLVQTVRRVLRGTPVGSGE